MDIRFDLFLTFAKIGAFTFGGGYAMLGLLDHEVVERKHWITEDELSDITVVAESTPGPIAINCATYTGQKVAGIPGSLAATVGMVLPSFLILLVVSSFLEDLLAWPAVAKAFRAIRIAVALIIIQAAGKLIGKMLKKSPHRICSAAFTAVFFAVVLTLDLLGVHFSTIYLILIAGAVGIVLDAVRGRGGTR